MNDILFRSSVAGFNKEDVLNYIEKLNQQSEEQSNTISNNQIELSSAFKKINELEKQMANYKQTFEELSLENDQYRSIINKGSESLLSEDNFSIDDTNKMNQLISENEVLKDQIDSLRQECNTFKENEKQIESLIMDSYIYSENILDDARKKAEKITINSKGLVEKATENIESFSDYVNNISLGFSEIVTQLETDLVQLNENLMIVTKELNNEKNDNLNTGDISAYIGNSTEHNDDGYATKDLTGFIKQFENIISGNSNISNENTPSSEEVIPLTQEDTFNLDEKQVNGNTQEHNIDDLIVEYSDSSSDDKAVKSDLQDAEDNIVLTDENSIEANFISSAPIGKFRYDEPPQEPLNAVVRLDKDFNLQEEQSNESEPEVTLESQPLNANFEEEVTSPLQMGMDYSDLFNYDDEDNSDDINKINTVEQFNSIVDEYASDNEQSDKELTEQSNNIDASTITSKSVSTKVDEPIMFDPDSMYSCNGEPKAKKRFGKVKIKKNKDK